MEGKEIICIVCPLGCQMDVCEDSSRKGYIVTGNSCQRGEKYGIKELTNPTRVLTTTVKLKNGPQRRLSVKTDIPISKDMIFACMKELDLVEAEVPVKVGDIIVANILNTGANIIATKSI